MQTISKEVFVFLEKLRKNNNREWFNAHKDEFKTLENQMKAFYADVEKLMNKHDEIQETKAYRIYRILKSFLAIGLRVPKIISQIIKDSWKD